MPQNNIMDFALNMIQHNQSITTASSTPWKTASVMATMAKAVIPVGAKVTMSHI